MARIERKAYYVGTWREDKVTDDTMRQIIARALAEKGQKVKVKLSEAGLVVIKTVLFQEHVVSSQALQDVYFLTVNQRQPCCLLCIVADPVRKYLIVALRTSSPTDAQNLITTFKNLKDNPTIKSGNVVLRRKDNGFWTLRERSQLNANRHLQEIFKEESRDPQITPAPPTAQQQPNGSAGGSHVAVIDSEGLANEDGDEKRYRLIPDDEVIVVSPQNEVEDLSQELEDVKLVVEQSTIPTATLQNDNNNTEKSYYIETEVLNTDAVAEPQPKGVITVYSNGHPNPPHQDDHPGEVRAVVDDHREDGVVRVHSDGDKPATTVYVRDGSGRFQHPIAVPEPETSPNSASTGYSDIPEFKIHRRVSTEYVQVPDFSRKVSGTGSLRSNVTAPVSHVSFGPDLKRRGKKKHDPRQFRSLRSPGVPTTVLRPIEEVYGHYGRPAVVKGRGGGFYVAQSPQAVLPPGSVVYVPGAPIGGGGAMGNPRLRRSRPNSIHVMEANELKVFPSTGEKQDVYF